MSKFEKIKKIIDSLLEDNDINSIAENKKKKILLLAKTLTKQCSNNTESWYMYSYFLNVFTNNNENQIYESFLSLLQILFENNEKMNEKYTKFWDEIITKYPEVAILINNQKGKQCMEIAIENTHNKFEKKKNYTKAMWFFKKNIDINIDHKDKYSEWGTSLMKFELLPTGNGHTTPMCVDILQKAHALNPNDLVLKKALNKAEFMVMKETFYGPLLHKPKLFPKLKNAQSVEEFHKLSTCAIKNVIPKNKLEKFTADYLIKEWGHITADYICHTKKFPFNKLDNPVWMPMKNAIELLKKHKMTYVMWNMKFKERNFILKDLGLTNFMNIDEYWLTDILSSDTLRNELLWKTHWYQFVIGSKDAGMFVHQDAFKNAAWHFHICGEKRWHIMSTENKKRLKLYTNDGAAEVNCFAPNYKSHPLFKDVTDAYMEGFTAGDAVYYPTNYYHQTHNVEDINMTFTFSTVDKHNYRDVINSCKGCCGKLYPTRRPYSFSDELCNELENVYVYWENKYS